MNKKILFFFILLLIIPIKVSAFAESAKAITVMDMDSNRILYSKNQNSPMLIASITKIMTAVVAIESGRLDDIVTIGKEVLPMYGSNIYIEVGEKISLRDLLYGLLLRSGNDAAVAIATYVGKTEAAFVKMMNNKAKEIGMINTVFHNSHGLDENTQNYSSSYDMAILSSYANKLEEYRKISGTKKYNTQTNKKSYLWLNRNKLLVLYENATGGKTGYTPKAGRTLVTTASKNGLNLTTVTLNDPNEYVSHEDAYEYVANLYENILIVDKDSLHIDDEFYKDEVYIKKDFTYPLTKQEQDKVKVIVNIYKLDDYKDGDVVGEIKVVLEDKELYLEDIYVKKEQKVGIFKKIINFFKGLFNIS